MMDPGERGMYDDRGRWYPRRTFHQRTSLEQQVMVGHLLPRYQPALEWQDTVWAQRVLPSVVASTPPDEPAVLRAQHDALRQWWRTGWGTVRTRVTVTAIRLASFQILAPRRPARGSPGS
jgi:hypothetical protein